MSTVQSDNAFQPDAGAGDLPGGTEMPSPQRDLAYHRLRRLLILRQVPPGTRLREAHWAARLGVNRTALREAFARLEAEGFIQRGAKSGYFAPGMQSDDLREVSEVRIMLEGGAIERIIQLGRNTREHLGALHEACSQLERAMEHGCHHVGVAEADRRFHEALIAATHNHRLTKVYRRAPLPLVPWTMIAAKEWEEQVRKSLDEHRAILAALMDGDAQKACDVLRVHLQTYPSAGPCPPPA